MKIILALILAMTVLISSSYAREMSCRTPDGGKHFIFIDKHGNESFWTQDSIDVAYKMNPHIQKYIDMKNLADAALRDQKRNHNKGNL